MAGDTNSQQCALWKEGAEILAGTSFFALVADPIVARWSLRRERGAGLYFIKCFGCLDLHDSDDERH